MEHVAEQDAAPEIDPAHGPPFTTDGDHGGRVMVEKPVAVPGDFQRELPLWLLHRHMPAAPCLGLSGDSEWNKWRSYTSSVGVADSTAMV